LFCELGCQALAHGGVRPCAQVLPRARTRRPVHDALRRLSSTSRVPTLCTCASAPWPTTSYSRGAAVALAGAAAPSRRPAQRRRRRRLTRLPPRPSGLPPRRLSPLRRGGRATLSPSPSAPLSRCCVAARSLGWRPRLRPSASSVVPTAPRCSFTCFVWLRARRRCCCPCRGHGRGAALGPSGGARYAWGAGFYLGEGAPLCAPLVFVCLAGVTGYEWFCVGVVFALCGLTRL